MPTGWKHAAVRTYRVTAVGVLFFAFLVGGCGTPRPALADVNPDAALLVDALRSASADFLLDPRDYAYELADACKAAQAAVGKLGVSKAADVMLSCAVVDYSLAIETALKRQPGNTLNIKEAIADGDEALSNFEKSVIDNWEP